ncbi:tRNA lysidine(34) synthetase TilS [Thermodesulfobacteriota bacterium]
MLQKRDAILVGVSGGSDSVALLHVLLSLAARFSLQLGVAHLNHCLRGKESDRDAEFVATLTEKLNLACWIKKIDVSAYQRSCRLSIEEAGRQVRYAFLNETADNNQYNKIAVGHHADDNAELVLMNLLRGSGLRGMAGIPPVREGKIIRPLIMQTKAEIMQFVDEERLSFVSDTSNQDIRFLRNKLRHHLMPLLRTEYNPNITATINRFAAIVREEDSWLSTEALRMLESAALRMNSKQISLSIVRLRQLPLAVRRRVLRWVVKKIKGDLRRIRFSHTDAVVDLIDSGPASASLDLPNRIKVRREGNILFFSKEPGDLRVLGRESDHEAPVSYEYTLHHPAAIRIPEAGIQLNFTELKIKNLVNVRLTGHRVAFFDMDKMNFPLIIRNVQPGDRFIPMGMPGTQKIKKFFINSKIPRAERRRCPVLLSQGKIIWVIGHRITDDVKVTPVTQNVMKGELFLA